MKKCLCIAGTLLILTQTGIGQSGNPRIDFETYNPPSSLMVPEHRVTKAKYPFIDVHNHQYNMPSQNIQALLTQMDSLNMKVMVNLSGRGNMSDPEHLTNAIQNAKKNNTQPHCCFYQRLLFGCR